MHPPLRDRKYRLEHAEREAVKAELHALLIACARARRIVTYSEVCAELTTVHLHPHSFVFAHLLREVCSEGFELGEGILCALVVSKTTGMPGGGYFRGMADLGFDASDLEKRWREDVEEVFARWAS
jgi:hypothetical protein